MVSAEMSVEIDIVHLGPGDYDRAKRVLNRARHPGFIGRELFYRAATIGRACVATLAGDDVGVALIVKDKLLALSVIATAQGHGVGARMMDALRPQWVQSIADRVSWFERRGYECVGAPKIGINGKHAVQLMQRRADAPSEASSIRTAIDVPAPNDGIDEIEPSFRYLDREDMDDGLLIKLDKLYAGAVASGYIRGALDVLSKAAIVLRKRSSS